MNNVLRDILIEDQNSAIRELECSWSMFNYAVTPAHTDLACKAIKLAEAKIDLIKETLRLNPNIDKKIVKNQTKMESIMKKMIGGIKNVF